MKVAVASQDGVSIADHFGRSCCFLVFDVIAGHIQGPATRRDSFAPHQEDACETKLCSDSNGHDYREMVAELEGCQVVLCRGMGLRAAGDLVRCGINPIVISDELSPAEAVQKYIDGALTPAAGFCRISGRPGSPPK